MNLVAPEEVEDRLQRTLLRRAEDVAVGDGAAWDPVLQVSPFGHRPATARRSSARVLAAAAAVVVVVVVGASAIGLATMGRDEPTGSVVAEAGDSTVVTPPPTVPPTAPTVPPTAPPTTADPALSIETAIGTFQGETVRSSGSRGTPRSPSGGTAGPAARTSRSASTRRTTGRRSTSGRRACRSSSPTASSTSTATGWA